MYAPTRVLATLSSIRPHHTASRRHFTSRQRPASSVLVILLCLMIPIAFVPMTHADGTLAGGDDTFIVDDYGANVGPGHLVMTSDGKLFCAVSHGELFFGSEGSFDVHRSLDGGTTWELWTSIPQAAGERIFLQKFLLTEGSLTRLHALYSVSFEGGGDKILRHAWVSPNSSSPTWSVTTPFSTPGYDFIQGDLATDVSAFPDYYLYAVAIGTPGGTQRNVWFTRSTTAGDSWEASYAITGDSGLTDSFYLNSRIAFGGGRVHLGFDYGDNCLGPGCIINSTRTMYGDNFISSGLSDWSGQTFHTLASGGVDSWMGALAASPSTNDVYLLYHRDSFGGGALLKRSGDAGSSWAVGDTTNFGPGQFPARLFYDPSGTNFYITGSLDDEIGNCGAQPFVIQGTGSPAVLQPAQCFSPPDLDRGVNAPALAGDPSAVGAFALAWSGSVWVCDIDSPWYVKCDATWFTNPGYPNQEPGFPLVLDHNPATPPLIAQLDADPFDEISYSDTDGFVHLLAHDGTEVGGWPKYAGIIPEAGQVAAGDLNGDGSSAIVVGNNIGEVWAWSTDGGGVLPGFPVDLGTNAPAYVAIAGVMPPWPRSIVACSNTNVFVLNYRGEIQREIKIDHVISLPPSIGDVDADGAPEILVAAENWVYQIDPVTKLVDWSSEVTLFAISAPLTLVDMSNNGEREILVPTVNGWVHDYKSDGTNPWSYDSGSFSVVSRIAAGDVIGNSTVEIVFTSSGAMHEVVDGGLSQGVYPLDTSSGLGGWLTDPVIESWAPGYAAANIAHSSRQQSWTWTNIGSGLPGWPKALDEPTSLASAVGDIDNDGSNEIVVLSDGLLSIWDVNHPPQATAKRKWPMAGGDPGRSNCHMCEDAIVTAVDDPSLPSQLAFAAPYPNPSGGETAFAFALPQQAGVQIDLYDVRGRLVRQLLRSTMGPGEHVIHFDGRDAEGRPLANGQYLARMQVRGGGVDRTLTRKLTLVR